MAKYNFHDYPKGAGIPDDINDPVKDIAINKLGCPELVTEIEDFQKCRNCGEIEVSDIETGKSIRFECNFGMFRGAHLIRKTVTDKYIITSSKFIKNHFLEMKKRKDGENGK